jgi:dienelactone hydrolase
MSNVSPLFKNKILQNKVCIAALMGMASLTAIGQTATTATAPITPKGEIMGTAWVHTAESLLASAQTADVVLPAKATGGAVFTGKFKDIPKLNGSKVPVVVFIHGSTGLALKSIGEWQQWLAAQGIASVAPDSFSLPSRVTYKSPIDLDSYERIHALRGSEITPMVQALKSQTWVDGNQLILAGSSEGSVAVAQYTGKEFMARILYAWSCEQNYFVKDPKNAFEAGKPVLNIISSTDPFFSKSNSWVGNANPAGHCGAVLKGNAMASVLLIPDAPHTVLGVPAARQATAGFLAQVVKN